MILSRLLFGAGLLPALLTLAAAAQPDPVALLAKAQARIGTPADLAGQGGVALAGEGRVDLSAALSGRKPGGDEPVAAKLRLLIDPGADRLLVFRHGQAAPDTAFSLERYFQDGQMRTLSPLTRTAIWQADPTDLKTRHGRLIPQLLLAELAARPEALRLLGAEEGIARIAGRLADGTPVELAVDDGYGVPFWVEADAELPFVGRVPVRWHWGDWQKLGEALMLPRSLSIRRGERDVADWRFDDVHKTLDALDFELPLGFDRALAEPAEEPRLVRRAPGVWQALDVRPGYHPLIVDFGGFLGIVDAPAADRDLAALPAGTEPLTAPSDTLRRLALQAGPGKPIRLVLLSHWHGDSAGGLAAFFQDQPTFVISPVTRIAVDAAAKAQAQVAGAEAPQAVAVSGSARSRARAPKPERMADPALLLVQGKAKLSGADRSLLAQGFEGDGHAQGMLVALLPEEKLVFQADLWTRVPQSADQAKTALSFARWLKRNELDGWTVLSLRDAEPIPADRLIGGAAVSARCCDRD